MGRIKVGDWKGEEKVCFIGFGGMNTPGLWYLFDSLSTDTGSVLTHGAVEHIQPDKPTTL